MNTLRTVADSKFRYEANSVLAHHEMSRMLGLMVNPNDITFSVWRGEQLLGGVIYSRYTHAAIFMHIIGLQRGWATKKLLWLAFHYPFEQLMVDRVFGLVASNNAKPLAFFKKLGFTVATTIEKVYPFADEVVLVMERKNCRWLTLKV
jgi:RimJ/RimL family protein N-acetyltransferase